MNCFQFLNKPRSLLWSARSCRRSRCTSSASVESGSQVNSNDIACNFSFKQKWYLKKHIWSCHTCALGVICRLWQLMTEVLGYSCGIWEIFLPMADEPHEKLAWVICKHCDFFITKNGWWTTWESNMIDLQTNLARFLDLLGLDVLQVQLWILGAKLNKWYRLQLFF